VEICDIVVVGAGPAGASAALELERRGHMYVLLDEDKFPRRKPCAGIMPPRVEEQLGPLPASAFDRRIQGYYLHSVSGLEFKSRYATPGYSVNRLGFDAWLISRLREKPRMERFVSASRKGESIRVKSNKDEYECKLMIGADGVNSAVRRWAGLEASKMAVAFQTEVPMGASEVLKRTGGYFHVFYTIPGGYGWVAPGKDRLRVGIGSVIAGRTGKRALSAFIRSTAVKKLTGIKRAAGIESHRIPMTGPFSQVAADRVLLAGDAGGFVFPGTGEGIRFAMKSGQVAARAASGSLRLGDASRLTLRKIYEEMLTEEGLLSLREVDFQQVLETPESADRYIKRLIAIKSG